MKTKSLIIGILLVVMLGAGYFYAQNQAQSYAEITAQQIKRFIEAADENIIFSYEEVTGNALNQSATLKKAKLKDRNYTASYLNIDEIEVKGDASEISLVRFSDIDYVDGSERVKIGKIQGENFKTEDLKLLKSIIGMQPSNLIERIGRLNTGAILIENFSLDESIKDSRTNDEIKIGEMKIDEIKNGKIEKIQWNNVDIKIKNKASYGDLEALKIENLSISGMDLFYLTSERNMEMGAAVGFGVSGFNLNKLSLIAGSTKEAITLNSLQMELSDFIGELPRSNRMTLENLVIPLGPLEDAGIFPRGYVKQITDRNNLDLSMKANLDLSTKNRELENLLEIELKGFGKLEQKASLSNINTNALRKLMENPNDEAAAVSLYFDSAFKSFSLTYDDEGLADHLFGLLIENFGKIYRLDNRNDLAALAELQVRQMLSDQGQLANDASEAVSEFIKNTKHFSIEIDAIKPLLFTELAGLYASGNLLSAMKIRFDGR